MTGRDEGPCEGDVEIDYMNEKRKIPSELSAEERLLYTYSQGITRQLLESMYENYIEALKQAESMPSSDIAEPLPDLNHQ